jgi:hypothetical protein
MKQNMQEKELFEYAVIRIVPRVEREEFLNVGVVLYCARQQFLRAVFELKPEKLSAFCSQLDTEEIRNYLTAFEQICIGSNSSGPIGKLGIAERFRWLTATRSTVVQTSKVHPGLCSDAEEKLQQLYGKLVL